MRSETRVRASALVAGAWISVLLLAHPAVAEDLLGPNAEIVDGDKCSAPIGSGGNLKTADSLLAGKCEGSGRAPRITSEAQAPGEREIEFSAGPEGTGPRDRSELALTEPKSRFQFGTPYQVSFEIKIPAGVDVTRDFFYLLQFWQGQTKPPIGGLRMQRGQDRQASIMVRGEGLPPQGHTVANVDLPPDQWVPISIRLLVNQGERGCIAASVNRSAEQSWCGLIGYKAAEGLKPWYRMKFGIYKGHEPDKQYKARFRKISISKTNATF